MSAEWNTFRYLWEKIYEKFQATHHDIGVEFVPYAPELASHEDIKNFDILQVSADSRPRFAESGYFFDMNELEREHEHEHEHDFYACFNDAVSWNGKRLGYPHVAAVNCYFWNKKFLEDSTSLSQSCSGFWNFFSTLSLTVKDKPVSALINTFPIEDLFRSADSSVSWNVDAKSIIPTEGFKHFLQHFEEYYCNNKVFYNECLNPSDIRDSFFNGRGLAISGNSCWIPDMESQKSLKFGILPPVIEPGCHVQVNCIVNAISNYTSYPEECLEFIQYLSSRESLTFFAENGRLTSRKDSNMNLELKALDSQSVENIKSCLEKGKVLKVMNPELRYNLFATVFHELRKWQCGSYPVEEVFEVLKRKINFYIRGMMIKKEGQDRK
jgi:ABC-type glycerol-3-phosphate transport system substrate-binding protein